MTIGPAARGCRHRGGTALNSSAGRSRSNTPTRRRFVGGAPPRRRRGGPGRSTCGVCAPWCARRSNGACSSTPSARGRPDGTWVDPLAGGHLSRPRRRDAHSASRLVLADRHTSPARSSRRSCTSCDWSTSPPPRPRDAGFIETDHFGVRFHQRASHVDLTGIPQRWLRDLVWDHLAALLQSPRCPRSGGVIDGIRRAAIELGVFLEIDAPGGGNDPTVLVGEHMRRFVADQRRRERDGLPSLGSSNPAERRASSPR